MAFFTGSLFFKSWYFTKTESPIKGNNNSPLYLDEKAKAAQIIDKIKPFHFPVSKK